MAKPKTPNDTGAVADMTRHALAAFKLNPVMGPHAYHFWEVQEQLLTEVEAFSRHWFDRRHAAVRTALKVSKDVIGNGPSDPAGVMRAINDWQIHSAERIAEDIQEWVGFCARCEGHLASGEAAASRETLEKASDEIAMVKTEHSDPV